MATEWETLAGQLPADADVEALLSQIRSLRAVAGPDAVRGLTADQLDALDTAICKSIIDVAGKRLPTTDTPFHKVASWAGASIRTHPVELFTPNYDLLLEQALEETRVPYFDGFVGAVTPFFDLHAIEADELPARWARLWKLHGSINWSLGEDGTVFRTSTENVDARRVIYPSHLKYEQSRRMPYLAFLDRLRAFLRNPSAVLITCGYSFRDQHLNEVLLDGAEGNPSSMIFGLLHGKLSQYTDALRIATTRANLTLLGVDAAVVGTHRDDWLKAEAQPAHTDKVAVEWEQSAEHEPFEARFLLGDFADFGALLARVMGSLETAADDAD